VRDLLRGQVPKDFDIATDVRPEVVQKIFPRTYAVGAHFGVIVVLENGLQFEVATFRSDGAYLDGRRPTEVHFATAKEDAARRDSRSTECSLIRKRMRSSTSWAVTWRLRESSLARATAGDKSR
jgi:hypothetical protein